MTPLIGLHEVLFESDGSIAVTQAMKQVFRRRTELTKRQHRYAKRVHSCAVAIRSALKDRTKVLR